MNRTLVIIKPDAYRLSLDGRIRERIKNAGLSIIKEEKRRLSRAEVEELYREHRGKSFFEVNTRFLLSGEVALLMVEGNGDAVHTMKRLAGDKNPDRARKGTIRGDYGIDRAHIERNLLHASSNEKEAEREVALFFENNAPE